jgi:hypothetical protein
VSTGLLIPVNWKRKVERVGSESSEFIVETAVFKFESVCFLECPRGRQSMTLGPYCRSMCFILELASANSRSLKRATSNMFPVL